MEELHVAAISVAEPLRRNRVRDEPGRAERHAGRRGGVGGIDLEELGTAKKGSRWAEESRPIRTGPLGNAPTDVVGVLAVVHGFDDGIRVRIAHHPMGVVAERTVSFEPAHDSLGGLGALALGGRQHSLDHQIVDRPTIDAGQLRDLGAGRRILGVGKMRVDARP